MRDFGIRGTERLWPTVDQPTSPEPIAYPTVAEAQPMTRPATPAQSAAITTPVATAAPVATVDWAPFNENRPPDARPVRKRTRPLRTVFLGVLLAGLGAWSFYGQPQENIVDLISYADERINVGRTDTNAGIVETSTPAPAQPVSTDRAAPVVSSVTTAPAAAGEVVLADEEAKHSEPEPAATTEEIVAVSENTNAAPMQTESKLDFIESIVSVSERDGAARIASPRTENLATPLIWWTSEHTANAETDFIAVEKQTMADASIADGNMLFVPLVNDDLPEAPESFFVNFGLRDSQQGQIERIALVRVDIIDDDLP
jgi:hypothetical protein